MKPFQFDDDEFRSLREFCRVYRVSYQKMRRLCRHYIRAKKDPAVAARWLLEEEELTPNEPKTPQYYSDLEKAEVRQVKFKRRMHRQFVENF